ncbi:AraC family transcriptional regulator [Sphingomonas sp.]|uniref:helix-turn-helix transcriptional regulator n=1 Tax=Sphingomonas sp. TaxID=28214 RepID=UPI0033415B5E
MCLVIVLRRHFARAGYGSGVLGTLRDPRLGKAITAVLDKPAALHSVASLASIAGMSRSAFAREFSNTLSMSPMAFVAKTRLHHAAELLRSTKLPVKVIAASIGFASRSHFSRAFAAAYGADPSRFRNNGANIAPAVTSGVPPAN